MCNISVSKDEGAICASRKDTLAWRRLSAICAAERAWPDCRDRAPLQLLIQARKLLWPVLPPARRPVAPTERAMACGALRSWCSARNGMSGSAPAYTCMPPNQCCARASPKSTLPQSHFHAQLKTACTQTRSVGVSAMAVVVGCDTRLGKRCRSRVGGRDGQPPPPSKLTAGEAGRELAALVADL